MHLSDQGLIVILVVGLIAGWLAAKVVRGNGFGVVGDAAIGRPCHQRHNRSNRASARFACYRRKRMGRPLAARYGLRTV
jgi:hypothetical protein